MDFKLIRDEFLNAVENFEIEQKNVLFSILQENSQTKYGKEHGFSDIKSIKDWQTRVPVTNYEDYLPYIKEIMEGKSNILTKEEVILLEPTSGSSSSAKLIPYTNGLKKAFNAGIKPWLSDLFINYPQIMNNPMYWSITPVPFDVEQNFITPSPIEGEGWGGGYSIPKIKIGFDNDIEYLDPDFAQIIAKNILVPQNIPKDTQSFQLITADFLSKYPDLTFVSVWNPYLFILFIEKLKDKPQNIWKNLKLISCWDEANSQNYAKKLQEYFPDTKIQGKGLLATEGIMTIPIENIGKIPSVKSHFFEFIDIKTNEIKLLQELETGMEYSILLTTQGGLYRYKIGDNVKVYDKWENCPLLSFQGRMENISDYFGEKLNEDFVNKILNKNKIPEIADFYMFAPYKNSEDFFYVLYIETQRDVKNLEKVIEYELCKNFHYTYARKLGQIKPFKIYRVKNGMQQYMDICVKNGQKLGDIKQKAFTNSLKFKLTPVLYL